MRIHTNTTRFFALMLCLASALVGQQRTGKTEDVVMKAMRDELARSMRKLQLESMEKPYFISYLVTEGHSASRSASFGSLNGRIDDQFARLARIQVRVGDYNFDNRNFFSYSQGSGLSRSYGGVVYLPVDDNYDEIRRQLWLATDSVYKNALESLAKKRAFLSTKNRSEVIPDFSKEPPVTIDDLRPLVEINIPEMEKRVRELSALFKQSPEIATSSVSLVGSNQMIRYVNSEGTSSTSQRPEVQLFVSASSQAPDGQPLSAGIGIRGRSMADVSGPQILEKIQLRQKQLAELRTAPLPDRYAGPVLFEGEAAPEIVQQRFLSHFLAMPEILTDNQQYRSMLAPDSENLVEKIGLRILPEFLSFTDDPTATSIAGSRLMGTSKVDDEGVPTRPMTLVENGLLLKLLTGRSPVAGFLRSSGSSYGGGVSPSNVIMTSNKSLPLDQLRADLVRRAKLRGKDYGVIVRKVDSSSRPGMAPGSMAVLLAYKRFADGHEELMRNAIVNGISFGSFKDILAVSDTPTVWNTFYSPRSPNPMESAHSGLISLAIPALLFEDATVQKPTGSVNKPPILTHPYFTQK